jgi:tetratricopeptide (TPR) repeat protein/tRNA A-37 threonylcarbamoyl transferase component Bud32
MPPNDPLDVSFGAADLVTTVDAVCWSGPFTDLTPHAMGGLGEVFRATDPELHRTVAVKRLRDRHADNLDTRRRFLVEAEVTARLEHPGVVPVYRLFQAEQGRPAYAMRFIEGMTFAEEIASYHAGPPDPVAFRRLLQAILQVCQTVAYAHSRGVIHRDLKPANVILGKFGETLVLDWGLAKVVGRPEEIRDVGVGETLALSDMESEPGETAMGSAVGTPAYMSPEQAAGRWDVVAQASDVYGLGAVLYTVLTGQPPLAKGNWPEMQQKIQQGDFPPPRQVKTRTPRALEAVCLKAMAVDPKARYASAEALAEDIEHWMADEPVAAHRESLPTQARRWMRRHRTLVSAAAVLLVAAVVGLSIGAVLLQRAQVETDQQRRGAVVAQRKAEAINRFLIDDLLKQADPLNNPVGEKLTVRQLLDKAADKLDTQTNLADQPEVEAEVRSVIGHAYEYLGVAAKAERHYRRAWELRSSLIGSDRAEVLALRNNVIWTVVRQGRLAEAEPLAQDALDACTQALGEMHVATALAALNLAEVRKQQGRFEETVTLLRRANRIANAALGPNDNKTLEIDQDLATALTFAGSPTEALPLSQSVVNRYRSMNSRHPELASTLSTNAGILITLGRFADAEPILREALDRSTEIGGADHFMTLQSRNLWGYALEGQERWDEAEQSYLAVLADRRRVEPSYTIERTLAPLARLYAKQKRWPEAARYLAELILSQHPDPQREPEALTAALSAALTDTPDPATSEPLLRECRDALKVRLVAGDWLIAEISSRYGDCLLRQGKLTEAEPILIAAANDVRKAVGVPDWGIAASRKRVANLYVAWQKPNEAANWR